MTETSSWGREFQTGITQMYRLLQLLYSTLSCIQEMNEHDKQRLVEFYKFKILKKRSIFVSLDQYSSRL